RVFHAVSVQGSERRSGGDQGPRRTILTIAGPRHLEERSWRLFRTMYPGAEIERLARKIRFVVIEPGDSVRFGPVRVAAIRTPHMTRDKSLAYRIAVGGRTIVFSGDSGWTDELLSFSAGADLFLCECTYFESAQLKFHINYPELAEKREQLQVKRLVLTHLGREVLEHMAEIQIETASDGMKIEV
ncbi:MAG: MBL fold metallo-hydrolase, partial [Candidatus Binataceae bacterium]